MLGLGREGKEVGQEGRERDRRGRAGVVMQVWLANCVRGQCAQTVV